jgi:hypothetical protein
MAKQSGMNRKLKVCRITVNRTSSRNQDATTVILVSEKDLEGSI